MDSYPLKNLKFNYLAFGRHRLQTRQGISCAGYSGFNEKLFHLFNIS